jgi:hypothetical protein
MKKGWPMRWFMFLLASYAILSPLAAQSQPAAESLVYAAPGGAVFTVTARGLSSIRVGGREVAGGGWYCHMADRFFAPSQSTAPAVGAPPQTQAIEVLGMAHARVRHTAGAITATYDYRFAGDDLTLLARVENTSETQAVTAMGFTGLRFAFRTAPRGLMKRWRLPEVQALGLDACHPSAANPIGGSYAADKDWGIGLSPLNPGLVRSLFLWREADPAHPRPTQPVLSYLLPQRVNPEGACTVQLRLRVSRQTDARYLLAPYKAYFQQNYGPVRYQVDGRPIAYQEIPAAADKVTADNPYGFSALRLDDAAGVRALATLVPALAAAQAQGLVLKGWGGYDPRGTDFAVGLLQTPKAVETHLAELRTLFGAQQLRLGAVTQPNGFDVRTTWERSTIIRVSADQPEQLKAWGDALGERIARGVSIFFFTNFGRDLNDLRAIMRYRTQHPTLQAFATGVSDVLLLHCPGLTTLTYDAKTRRYVPGIGEQEFALYRWMLPEAAFAAQVQSTVTPAGQDISPAGFCYRHHLIPVLAPSAFTPTLTPVLRSLTEQYLNPQGQWRDAAVAPGQAITTPVATAQGTTPRPDSKGPATAAAERFTYAGPGHLIYTVTADGLAAITLGDRQIARGSWVAQNLEEGLGVGASKLVAGPLLAKSLAVVDAAHARVVHVQQHLTTTYDYRFAGEDVTIQARVENTHPAETQHVLSFGNLTFTFATPPRGIMPVGQHRGFRVFHPGFDNRIGGSYATDGQYGVGVSPWKTGWTHTMCKWLGFSWDGTRGWCAKNDMALQYSCEKPVAPLGAESFYLKLRVSTTCDWQHLLAPYKAHYLATFGPQQYTPDHRLLSQSSVASPGGEWITPGNPLGFQQHRRIDLPEGMKQFATGNLNALKAANGSGMILWAHSGFHPTGNMYRTDPDVLPAEIEKSWPLLQQAFAADGRRLGVCTRPGEITTRWRPGTEITLRFDGHDPAQREMHWRRLKAMIDRGCTVFYIDTFGNDLEDAVAMQYYRAQMGPEILTYSEYVTDVILPYTGAYTEIHYGGGKGEAATFYLYWYSNHQWEIFHWLQPEVNTFCLSRINSFPEGVTSAHLYRWLLKNHFTYAEQDWRVGGMAKEFQPIQAEYVDAQGRWIK